MAIVNIKEQKIGQKIPNRTIKGIIRAIADNFPVEKIILFGSYAKGNATADSDLDMFVIMETDLPRHKRSVPLYLLFSHTPCAMDIVVYTPEEVAMWNGTVNHLITDVLKTGKVVYER